MVVRQHVRLSGRHIHFDEPHVLMVLADKLRNGAISLHAPIGSVWYSALIACLSKIDPPHYYALWRYRRIDCHDPQTNYVARLSHFGPRLLHLGVPGLVHIVDILSAWSLSRSRVCAKRHVQSVRRQLDPINRHRCRHRNRLRASAIRGASQSSGRVAPLLLPSDVLKQFTLLCRQRLGGVGLCFVLDRNLARENDHRPGCDTVTV